MGILSSKNCLTLRVYSYFCFKKEGGRRDGKRKMERMEEAFEPRDYELLPVPGESSLQIAVVPASYRRPQDSGSHYVDWTFTADTIFLPKLFVDLYGWYSESARDTGMDVAHHLYTSAAIKHTELIVVIPNGQHLATFENKLVKGSIISNIVITRLIKTGAPLGVPLPIQVNTYKDSFVTGVQQILDCVMVRFRILKKQVECTTFSQKGIPNGVGCFEVNFAKAKAPK